VEFINGLIIADYFGNCKITASLEDLKTTKLGKPEFFNTDQGSQFTSESFLNILKSNEIQISMDGKGRCMDNIFVERLWRTVKYEEVYCKSYENFKHAYDNLSEYFIFYNDERIHQALKYKVPKSVHFRLDNVATPQ